MTRVRLIAIGFAALPIACAPAEPAATVAARAAAPWPYVAEAPVLAPSDAPQIVLDGTTVLVDGTPEGVIDIAPEPKRIDGLLDALRVRREAWKAQHAGDFPGVVNLFMPNDTPALIVKRLVVTAAYAGYPHVRLGVRRGDGTELGYLPIDAAVPLPPVSTDRPQTPGTTTNGRLAPEIIQRVVRANFGQFRRCYEAGLKVSPHLNGRVNVKFVIEADGRVDHVEDAKSDLPDPKVIACIERGFEELVFPRPEGGIVTVVYPIIFSPGDQ